MALLFQLPPLRLPGYVDSRIVHRAAPHGVQYILSIGTAGANYSMCIKSLGQLGIVKVLKKQQEPLTLLSVDTGSIFKLLIFGHLILQHLDPSNQNIRYFLLSIFSVLGEEGGSTLEAQRK